MYPQRSKFTLAKATTASTIRFRLSKNLRSLSAERHLAPRVSSSHRTEGPLLMPTYSVVSTDMQKAATLGTAHSRHTSITVWSFRFMAYVMVGVAVVETFGEGEEVCCWLLAAVAVSCL